MRSPFRIFAIASIAVFLVSIDATVLYAAFPALQRAFPDASAADLSWVLNAYTVVFAALLVPSGRLADLHGRKRMFVIGGGLFLAASLACGLSGSVAALVVSRMVQAIGAALLLPSSLAIVLAAFPIAKRAVAVALWGAVGGLAAAVGPSIGSFLVERMGWEWAFFVNLPIGGAALWRAARVLDESRNPENGAPLDVPGVVLVVAGIAAIAFGLVHSGSAGWSAPTTLAALAGGAILLAVFVQWARRAAYPAIDLALFQERTYRYVNLATLTFGIGFAMMFFTMFQFMTGVWHYSVATAGLAATPGPLMVIPTSIVAGRFAARAGHRTVLIAGSLVFGAGMLWAFAIAGAEPDYVRTWLPGSLLTGIGVGMVLPSLSGAAVARLPPTRFGIGGAVNQAIRQIGSVLGVAIAIAIVGNAPTLDKLHTAWLVELGFALATAVLCIPVDTRPRR